MSNSYEINQWLPDFSLFVEVGDPRYTAFDINDRGNRIYLKYEPSQPTIFPTRETRFYKPKLHLKDLEGNKKKDRGGTRDL